MSWALFGVMTAFAVGALSVVVSMVVRLGAQIDGLDARRNRSDGAT